MAFVALTIRRSQFDARNFRPAGGVASPSISRIKTVEINQNYGRHLQAVEIECYTVSV